MTTTFLQLLLLTPLLLLVQALLALPWLAAIDFDQLRSWLRQPRLVLGALGGILGTGLALAFVLDYNRDEVLLSRIGRGYAALAHVQLVTDLLVLVLFGLLRLWPKGGAVTLASFREGVRQPMFWLLFLAGFGLLGISPFIPYFTFGEDFKVVKDLAYVNIMLVSAAFAVLAASMSIAEEIEGRTAVTLMSKPITRRDFLLGKFVGILLAALVLAAMLGWFMIWVLLFKSWWDPQMTSTGQPAIPDPGWVLELAGKLYGRDVTGYLIRGIGFWTHDAVELLPGQIISFCQVMVLLAIAVALATRLPVIVNLPVSLSIYFLGHLTSILKEVSHGQFVLITFMAQVFDTTLPGLDHFDLGSAVIRDAPPPMGEFALYTFYVSLYALMYTAIALLFGLILFEDRDLA